MPAPDRATADRSAVFSAMWGVAMLAHLWNQANGWDVVFGASAQGVAALFALAATLFLLSRPASVERLVLVAAAQLLHVAAVAPFIADHWMLDALVNTAVLAAAARVWWRDRRLEAGAFFAAFAPAARVLFVVCYGAAALAKFNDGFLDPQESCGRDLLGRSLQFFALSLPPWIPIALTLVTETAVAFFPLVPRLRTAGIRAGLFFHFFLSLTTAVNVVDFTTAVYALLFLFSPDETTERLRAIGERLAARVPWLRAPALRRRGTRIAALAVFVWVAGVVPALARRGVHGPALFVATELFNVWCVLVVVLALLTLSARPGEPASSWSGTWSVSPAFAPSIALAVLVVASPYVGGRNVGVFTMFSNLRTEGGVTNHFFLPRLAWLPWEDDLAEIESSDDPVLARLRVDGKAVNFLELKRRVQSEKGVSVVYVRGGRRVEHSPEHPDPALMSPIPFWERKLLLFRPIRLDRPVCWN
ncbi:MAG TPA: hypothetical protein VMV18_04905 [bacterium]|nr:hypothetical protein [bacterium]